MGESEASQYYPSEPLMAPGEEGTTRELPSPAPAYPAATLVTMACQIVAVLAAVLVIARGESVLAGIPLLLAMILFSVTHKGWLWWLRYPKSRILTRKQLSTLAPGMWVVPPGSRYAVRMREAPTGMQHNPVVADGLTWEELHIMAPIYGFKGVPKGSEAS